MTSSMREENNGDSNRPPLDIVIIGAGIAGLSATIALRRAGHNITVIERSSMTNEVGAAIHVCPNAARVLLPWGLDPKKSRLVTSRTFLVARGDTLQPLANFTHEGLQERFGAPCYFAHRVDLHDELKRLAFGSDGAGKPPPTLRLKIATIGYEPDSGIVKLSDGTEVKGDLVIGADGIHSKAVEAVVGDSIPAVPSGSSCFRFLIPTEDLLDDPVTAPLMDNGDGRFRAYVKNETDRIAWYPCRDNKIQNFTFIHADTDGNRDLEDWNRSATQEVLIEKLKGFHPSLAAVCLKAKEMKMWKLLVREPLSTWHRSRLVVIGDAAHPMLPHQGQAGAMAIEDSAALGKLFENFRTNDLDAISKRLDLFEKIRMNRASAMQMLSNFGQDQVEKSEKKASKYIPDGNIPRNHKDFEDFNYGPDVVEICSRELRMLSV